MRTLFFSSLLLFLNFSNEVYAQAPQCMLLSSVSLTPKGLGKLLHLTCNEQRKRINDNILKLSERKYDEGGKLLKGPHLQEEICVFKTNKDLCDSLPASDALFGAFKMLKQCKGSPFAIDTEGYVSIPDKPIPIKVCIKDTEMRNIDLDCGEKPPKCTESGCDLKIGVRRLKMRGKLHITNLNTGELLTEPQVVDFRVTPNKRGEVPTASAQVFFDRDEKRIELAAKVLRGKSKVDIPGGSLWIGQPIVAQTQKEQDEEDLEIYNALVPVITDANRRAGDDKTKILKSYERQLQLVEDNLVQELLAESDNFGEDRTEVEVRKSVKAMLKDGGVDATEFLKLQPLDLSKFQADSVRNAKLQWVRDLPPGYEMMAPVQQARKIIRAKKLTELGGGSKKGTSYLATALAGAYINGKMQEDPGLQELINQQVMMRATPNIESNLNALLESLPSRMGRYIDKDSYDSTRQALTIKSPTVNLNRKNQVSMLAKKYDKSGELAAQSDNYEADLLRRHTLTSLARAQNRLGELRVRMERCRGNVITDFCKDLKEEYLDTSQEIDSSWRDIEYYDALLSEDRVNIQALYALDKLRKVNEALKLNIFNDCREDCDRDIKLKNFGGEKIPEDVDLRTELTLEGIQKLLNQMYQQGKLEVCRELGSVGAQCDGVKAKLKSPPKITYENGKYKLDIPDLKIDYLGDMKFSGLEVTPRLCGDGQICLDSTAFRSKGTIRMGIAGVNSLVQSAGQGALDSANSSGLPAVPHMKGIRLLQNKNNGALAIDWELDTVTSRTQVYKSMKALQDLGF